MHKYRRRIQLQRLEHIRPLVIIHQAEKQLGRIGLRISERIRHDLKLFARVSANGALPLRGQRREHYDHRVVPRRRLHELSEFIPIQSQHGALVGQVRELLHAIV